MHRFAHDAHISQATGYCYLYEAIDALADTAPDLHQALQRCREHGTGHVVLGSTLISCDRVAGGSDIGNDAWYSEKTKHFAGNMRLLACPDAAPLWVSEVEPGSRHDLTCARSMCCPRSG